MTQCALEGLILAQRQAECLRISATISTFVNVNAYQANPAHLYLLIIGNDLSGKNQS